MSTLTNVFQVHRDATGTAYTGPMNLGAYHIMPGGTAGEIVFRDGGAGGTVRLRLNVSTSLVPVTLLLPGNGIRFNTDIHITFPTGSAATIFLG